MSGNPDEISILKAFENSEELVAAVAIQNALHPKNANRVEAIKAD